MQNYTCVMERILGNMGVVLPKTQDIHLHRGTSLTRVPTLSLSLGSWGGRMGVGALLLARYPWTTCHSPCPMSTPSAMISKDSPCTVYTNPDSYSAPRNHPPLFPLHSHITRTVTTGAFKSRTKPQTCTIGTIRNTHNPDRPRTIHTHAFVR